MFLAAVAAIGVPQTLLAQDCVSYTAMSANGLSPEAATLLLQLRSDKPNLDHHPMLKVDGQNFISSFVIPAVDVKDGKKVAEWRKAIGRLGVKVVAEGRQWTVLIPVGAFEALATSGLCSYIDLGHKNTLHNNRIRGQFAADYIHRGEGLVQGYDGTGVVVGIIDVGFDYGHPSFWDSTGSTLRVKRVWSQLDSSGTPPEGFFYGSEYATPQAILAARKDNYAHTHGTHVAGTAAGCGAPDSSGRRYRGIAPAADLVLVGTTLQDPDVYNAILYIHRYARSVGKPCVINMSLGDLMGSHDGLTGIDANIANYLNAPAHTDSIVLVASASNDGTMPVHLHRQFSDTDTALSTIITMNDTADIQMGVDIWGETGNTFDVEMSLYRASSGTAVVSSPLMHCAAGMDSVYSFVLADSASGTPYVCSVTITPDNPLNHRANARIIMTKARSERGFPYLVLTVRSHSANTHMWCSSGYFISRSEIPASVRGDDNYSICGVGTNGTSVISVGSYNVRQAWRRPDGSTYVNTMCPEGAISYFSSHGPTIDGRSKPDIATPGAEIVSSVSSYYPDYLTNEYLFDSVIWDGQTKYFATMSGTSMASPAAAGVVALWLQENPVRNVDSVRAIMHATALQDEYTGVIGENGSNIWGWGKLNALGGLPTNGQFYSLVLKTDNVRGGTVEGAGRHMPGMRTVTAYPARGYVFAQWEDGVTANPRQVNLVSDTTLVAIFERTMDCDTIVEFPTVLTVDEDANCWYNIDGDGDGEKWAPIMSRIAVISLANTDDWLITPPIKVVAGLGFRFNVQSLTGDVRLSVTAAEGSTDTADFTNVLIDEIANTMTSGTTVNLSAYAGRTVRLALRAYGATQSSIIMVDSLQFVLGMPSVGIPDSDSEAVGYSLDGRTLTLFNPQGLPVTVYDVVGRLVATFEAPVSSLTLPAAGVYTIRYGNNAARKIVVR